MEDLRKDFGGGTVAVDRLSFTVGQGEVLGLLGTNGAGKTTAMHMVLGLIRPTSGRIRVFGLDLGRHRVEILRRANFSSAYAQLPSNLRAWQNLDVFARLYGVRRRRQKIEELLERFEIAHLRKRLTGHLSSGEATRLNLCKALLNDPELLLLDEPTASLDPDIADKVRRVINEEQASRGMAILYTSHNMRDVEEVCDRVVFVHRGRMIAEGTPGEVTGRWRGDTLEEVFIEIARGGDLVNAPAGDGGGARGGADL